MATRDDETVRSAGLKCTGTLGMHRILALSKGATPRGLLTFLAACGEPGGSAVSPARQHPTDCPRIPPEMLSRPYLAHRLAHYTETKENYTSLGTGRSKSEVRHTCHPANEGPEFFKLFPSVILQNSLYAIKANKKPILVLDLKTLFIVCHFYSVATPQGAVADRGAPMRTATESSS